MQTELLNDTEKQNEQKQEAPSDTTADTTKSRLGLLLAGGVVILIVLGAGFWWWQSQGYESTDDAQVDSHLNPISARVAGTIQKVYVEDNQHVEAGTPLVDLDTKDYEVTHAQLQAQYDEAVAQLRGEQPNLSITMTSNNADAATAKAEVTTAEAALAAAEHDYGNAVSQLAQAEANNGRAQSDLRRYQELIDKHEVAQSEYDQYNAAAKAQAATVAAQKESAAAAAKTVEQRRAQMTEQQFKLAQTVQNAPRQVLIRQANIQARSANLESIKAQLMQNDLNMSYCHLLAPVSGLVSQRSAELGARISSGQQLMMLVQTGDVWVTANFKETQLKKMRRGQPVTIKVDSLDKTFKGEVESMPAATGDRTSALPPENATGNFVKIVQRLPVRIKFLANQQGLQDLRPGMSVEPEVQVR
jgi:membrane fusion protein (multidrug efflux system)